MRDGDDQGGSTESVAPVDPVVADVAGEGAGAPGDLTAGSPGARHPGPGPGAGGPGGPRGRLIATAEGTSTERFTPRDWGLLVVPSLVWGSSFLLIAEGLATLAPGTITWLRMVFGFAALAFLPATRGVHIAPGDRRRIALVGIVWMAFPMTMFPIAEQWIDSSVTGMLNGALPLFTALIAGVLLRRTPGRAQLMGLGLGFAGVVLVGLPSLRGGSHTALGAALVIVAMVSYGLATNLVVPLQQRYGALPVIWRAQAVAVLATAPYGLFGLRTSSFAWRPLLATLVLGAVGTGFAFIAATTLMGRVGATRGSVLAYLIPVVALVLGVVLRDEHVEAVALAGLVLVLGGAWLTSRAGH
ncbi:MAG: family transporter [Acidimicrobiales bacterium]|nr:family transporter [Acidimicrobiales bacterium]